MAYTIIIFLITYLICSFSPAIFICKLKTGEDIRRLGDFDASTSNCMKVLGKPRGTITIILDILKVMLSFYIVSKIGNFFNQDTEFTLKKVFIVASVIGHCFPIYYSFKGGKGAIVGIATAVMIDRKIAIVCIIAGVLVILITRYLALGTICGLVLYVLMTIVMMPKYLISVIVVSIIVLYRHRENIQRMMARQEEKLW